ncbi:hypothetical protein Bca101_067404 [Brassica carinata]
MNSISFKENVLTTPTKASHAGMPPTLLEQANDECDQLAHLATTLLDFPDENLTKRQIQQFLGVINYVSDFIPHLSRLTRPLQKMLTKNSPQWQTDKLRRSKA